MYTKLGKIGMVITTVLIIGVGCNSVKKITYIYNVEIFKSDMYSDTHKIEMEKDNTNLAVLTKKIDPEAQTQSINGQETVTKLEGVISTLSKEWKIYINSTSPEFINLADVTVQASDQIEWRYE